MIDVNPRFYEQMGFDVARHLPLPELVYHAGLGDREFVRAALQRANDRALDDPLIHCRRMMFELLLAAQLISGKFTVSERRRWRAWYARNGARAADAVHDSDDPAPTLVEIAAQFSLYARHPGNFVRNIVLNRRGGRVPRP
jgi:hypothetical protein